MMCMNPPRHDGTRRASRHRKWTTSPTGYVLHDKYFSPFLFFEKKFNPGFFLKKTIQNPNRSSVVSTITEFIPPSTHFHPLCNPHDTTDGWRSTGWWVSGVIRPKWKQGRRRLTDSTCATGLLYCSPFSEMLHSFLPILKWGNPVSIRNFQIVIGKNSCNRLKTMKNCDCFFLL